jgi:hypothetical protein
MLANTVHSLVFIVPSIIADDMYFGINFLCFYQHLVINLSSQCLRIPLSLFNFLLFVFFVSLVRAFIM